MTQYYEVGLEAKMIFPEGEFRIIHPETFRKFKNLNDAQEYQKLLNKLQNKKGLFPHLVTLASFPGQPSSIGQINSFLNDTGFFTQNELNQNELKKTYIKSKLDDEELADLGLTP